MTGINPLGNDYSWLFNSTRSQNQNAVSKLWSNYTSAQQNATSALSGLSEINANLKSVLSSYDEAKTTFNSEFSENMSSLAKSAAKVSNFDFSVPKEGAITKTDTTDADGKVVTTTTYSKELQAAFKTVEDLVNDYNASLKFFQDNGSLSKRVENLANVFNDAAYRSSNYESIGLIVNSDGSLTINDDKLANAILENPDKISSILGKDGLAGKAQAHIDFANSQADRLFPTVASMLGDQIQTATLYTGKAYLNMTSYASVGNLLNMMF